MVPSLRLLICKMGTIMALTLRALWSRSRPPASCREGFGEWGKWMVGGVLFQPREGQGLPEATHQKCPQDPSAPRPRCTTAQQGEGKISKLILMRSTTVASHMIEFLLCSDAVRDALNT